MGWAVERQIDVRRRDFLRVVAGSAFVWPIQAGAQPIGRVRRVGVLMGYAESDPDARSFANAFAESLQQSATASAQSVTIEYLWAGADVDRIQKLAKDLVELRPDVILANTTPVTVALHRQTREIPIVFVIVSDPVGAGVVTSLSRPGGNITGFINVEGALGGKWLELVKEIAPGIRRSAIMYNPDTAPGGGAYFLESFKAASRMLEIEPIIAPVRNPSDIERSIAQLAGVPAGGLVVAADGFMVVHRAAIISSVAKNNVPAVYFNPAFPKAGGLVAYGADSLDVFRRAGPYVNRILLGEKPGDLPVQVPTKFELVINLKTAKAFGLTVPPAMLVRADRLIE